MRENQERFYAGTCHFFNWIPIWGILFAGAIWFFKREESRKVIFHARQAMRFHTLLMAILFVWCLINPIGKIVAEISPNFSRAFLWLNNRIFFSLYLVYLIVCLYGFTRTTAGYIFRYPIINRSQDDGSRD